MKMKKLSVLILALALIMSTMSLVAFADAPIGNMTTGFTDTNRVWGEVYNCAATKSFAVEIYSNETLIATTTLNDVGNALIDGMIEELTWGIYTDGTLDEYWNMVWEKGHPASNYAPTKAVFYVDESEAGETNIVPYTDANRTEKEWKAVKGVTYIESATISELSNRTSLSVDVYNLRATKDIVGKYYSGETKIATTTYVGSSELIDMTTVNTVITGKESSSWETQWHEAPSVKYVPSRVELYIDGVLADAASITKFIAYPDRHESKLTPEVYVEIDGVAGVAKIGDTQYASIQSAVNAATDGDEITLIDDTEDTTGTHIEKNVTIDLNEHTYTSTGEDCNNRCFLISGSANVTIKNGTIIAKGETVNNNVWGASSGTGSYGSVRMESSGTLNLTDITTYNYRGWGSNVKAISGKTICTNVDIYAQYGGGFEAAGGEVELNNCNVEQKGTYYAPYNSAAASVSTNGKITINSGTYSTTPLEASDANNQGTSHGSWTLSVMNSGGTMIINGGTFSNDNYGDNSLATNPRTLISIGANAADDVSELIINDGKFVSLAEDVIFFEGGLGKMTATVKGGLFNVDPTDYVPQNEGYVVGKYVNDMYTVTKPMTIKFEESKNEKNEIIEGSWDINLYPAEGEEIYEFVAAELILNNDASRVEGGFNEERMHYDVYGIDGKTSAGLNTGSSANGTNQQVYRINTFDKIRLSTDAENNKVTIGKVVFAGKGTPALSVIDGSRIVTTIKGTNDEMYFTAGNGTLLSNPLSSEALTTPRRTVKINVDFEHDIYLSDEVDYRNIKVTLKDSIGTVRDAEDILVTGVNYGYAEFTQVPVGVITVTLKAPGFRTYTYQTTMEEGTGDFELDFWNSVRRDSKEYIEKDLSKGEMSHNFLVGDIAMDYIIDKYDLAAVTSYYGNYDIKAGDNHVKYDLNRDHQIDILDVAYVLHGMGN